VFFGVGEFLEDTELVMLYLHFLLYGFGFNHNVVNHNLVLMKINS